MNKRIKCIIKILCCFILIFSNSFLVSAAEADVLLPYKEKLAHFNELMGTQYKIPTSEELSVTDMTIQELNDFYTSMNLEEFENYISELHALNIADNNARPKDFVIADIGLPVRATETEQFYYYSSANKNYLALKSKIVTVNNVAYYNSFVDLGYNTKATGYPYYVPQGKESSYSVSSDSRQMYVAYKCTKYISATVIDTGYYTINVTFTAGS